MFSYRLVDRCRLMARWGRVAVSGLLAVLVFAATSTVAIADSVFADGDITSPTTSGPLNFGEVCVNSTASADKVGLAASRSGKYPGKNVFKTGTPVTFSVVSATQTSSIAGTTLTATTPASSTVTLPANWGDSNNILSDFIYSIVTLSVGSATGNYSAKVSYNASGTSSETNGPLTLSNAEMSVTAKIINTGACAVVADTTAPSVTVSIGSPVKGLNGWFNELDATPVAGTVTATDASNVTAITCTDSIGGGLALGALTGGGTSTASRSLSVTGDGTHAISCTATDAKNNSGAATGSTNTATVKIDRTAPTLTPGAKTADGAAYASGSWTNQAVTVSFACSDATSQVVGAYPTSQTLTAQTVNGQLSEGCSDNAGNAANATFSGINIDKTLPLLTGEITTASSGTDTNLVKWYNSDVNVRWKASDSPSGVDPSTIPADSTVAGEGSNRGAGPVSVRDLAGNTGTGSISGIRIDRNGPTITPAVAKLDGSSYASGTWTNQAVRVTYSCADPKLADNTAGSGVATCPSAEVRNTDGANQSVTGAPAKDYAGNTTPGATVTGISIDGQAPQTTSRISCTGKNGYCRGMTADVILTATDQAGLSGVKEIRYSVNGGQEITAQGATKTVTVSLANNSGEGTVEYFAVDNAGNAEAKTGVALKYDNLAPIVTAVVTPTPNASDWNNADLSVHFDAVDDVGGSGVNPATVTPDVDVTTETAGLLVSGQADDMAGNTGFDSVTVKLDKTKPTVTPSLVPGAKTTLSANGWYNGPVSVTFACADPNGANGSAGSGATSCPVPVTFATDGANQGTSRTILDLAGNTSAPAEVSGINIDATKPVVTISGLTQSAPYALGTAPALSCSATDATSGVVTTSSGGTCTGTLTGGNTNGVGTFTYTATATDLAGNVATESVTYSVIYAWVGFSQPINDTAHQVGVATSVFKGASTVPVKFQVKKADGTPVQFAAAPQWLTPAKGAATNQAIDEALYGDVATTGTTYRWDATGQQYIYNWGTAKNQAGSYWRIGVKLDDGQVYSVNIGLR